MFSLSTPIVRLVGALHQKTPKWERRKYAETVGYEAMREFVKARFIRHAGPRTRFRALGAPARKTALVRETKRKAVLYDLAAFGG